MNFRDDAGVTHRVLTEPVRPSIDDGRISTGGRVGMTECVTYFRWNGQTVWVVTESVGIPTRAFVTCVLCIGEQDQ